MSTIPVEHNDPLNAQILAVSEDKIQGFGKFHTLDGKTIEGIWRESKLSKIISNG